MRKDGQLFLEILYVFIFLFYCSEPERRKSRLGIEGISQYLGMNMGISLASLISRSSAAHHFRRVKTQDSNTQKNINGGQSIEKMNAGLRQIPTHLRGVSSMRKIYHRRHGSGIHELMSLFWKRKKSTSLPHGEKQDGE
jgi:hypothetical protein